MDTPLRHRSGVPSFVEVSLLSDPKYLAVVCTMIREFARLHGMVEELLRKIELAVDEVCSNVIVHAYEGRHDAVYRVRCTYDEPRLVIEVFDRGHSFSLEQCPKPKLEGPLKSRGTGGLGIHFIRKIMDEVEYEGHLGGENCFRMIKKVA